MDNLSALNLIIGFVTPLVISTINRPNWSSSMKILVTVLVSVTFGFLSALFSDQLNPEDVTSSILTILVTSIATYNGIFKPSGVGPRLELATSPERKLDKGDMSG